VAASGDVFGLEVTVDDGQLKALPRPDWQVVESCWVAVEQVKPPSFLHLDEQPSPSSPLPSSHSSPGSRLPSPQEVVQACVLPLASWQFGSLVQVFEQPLPSP